MTKVTNIPGRLHSVEQGNIVAGANEIYDDTKGKKQNVINSETDAELLRLEQAKQDNLTFDNAPTENSNNPVKSGGVYAADLVLQQAIEAILLLIPSAATSLNQLADKAFVNSSISTATATFRGTYNVVTDLHLAVDATHAQIESALASVIATADNNDYCYVQIPVSSSSQDIQKTSRYKFNGTAWVFEYDLNTSGFTSAQWAAINSGITAALVTKLGDLPTATELSTELQSLSGAIGDEETRAKGVEQGLSTAVQGILGLIPSEATSSNQLADKTYVTNLINAITALIPAEATDQNQLADKAYVLAQILAATPAVKGQFTTLADLQAVVSPKAGDLGIVRTTDSDGYAVFTFYQYLNNQWNVYFTLSHHNQKKPATTGTTGNYPYNGMGRVVLDKDVDFKTQVEAVTGGNTIFVICYDFTLTDNVTIPVNCVLDFDGGSLSGEYTLTGNLTSFIGFVSLGSDITFAGTYNNIPTVYVDWFVRQYNVNIDCSNGIWKAIQLAKLARTSLTFGGEVSGQSSKYFCTSGNFDVSGLVVHGNGSYINGIGNFNVFIVNGDCCIDNLCIGKFPYQDGTSESPYQNFAIVCQGNNRMKFDNVYIDGFYYGFYLDAAWNVIIDGCHTHRCSFGVYSSGLSVNNNIVNSRISGTISGIEIISSGGAEGFMIANNLIVGGKGIRLYNCANSIIKGNIIDLCTIYGIEIVLNCPGILVEGNYIAINTGASSCIIMYAQNIVNNEDQMIYFKNNIIKSYGSTVSYMFIISEGKYKHINISGNHLKSIGGQYELVIGGNINHIDVLYIRDNVIEGDINYTQISVPDDKITNKFVTDNVVLNLMPSE